MVFYFDGHSWSAAVGLSDNIITTIFKQHWQMQSVPGLSTAAESIVDSEMLILFVYFPAYVYIFPVQPCLGIFTTKTQRCFSFWKGNQVLFFFLQSSGKRHNPLWWKLSLSSSFHSAVPGYRSFIALFIPSTTVVKLQGCQEQARVGGANSRGVLVNWLYLLLLSSSLNYQHAGV